MLESLWWLIPIIFAAGCIDAIAGGGGLLTVPAYLMAGIPPAAALGTNKFVSCSGTTVAAWRYFRHGTFQWPVLIVGGFGMLIGSAIGANFAATMPEEQLRSLIIVALPLATISAFFGKRTEHVGPQYHWRNPRLWTVIIPITLSIGGYDGVFGPGTGSWLIIALFGWGQLSLLESAATGRMFNWASNAGALAMFLWHGHVLYQLALPLALAAMAGNWCGSHLAIRHGAHIIRRALFLIVAGLTITLIWQQMTTH